MLPEAGGKSQGKMDDLEVPPWHPMAMETSKSGFYEKDMFIKDFTHMVYEDLGDFLIKETQEWTWGSINE